MGIVEKFANGGVVIDIQGLAEKLLADEIVTPSDFYRFFSLWRGWVWCFVYYRYIRFETVFIRSTNSNKKW